jgi:hypothetical protein
LELGEVLGNASPAEQNGSDGSLLREMTPQDELLQARVQARKERAFRACQELLDQRGITCVLMDVEHLFDGGSLFFYFLGEVPAEVAALTGELAEAYEAQVQMRNFADTVTQGCGPGCGTEQAEGPGCGSTCASCPIAGSCA